jgi:hypothetical protein
MSQVLFWIFVLILVALLVRYWKGTSTVAATGFAGATKMIATLQNPGGYPA